MPVLKRTFPDHSGLYAATLRLAGLAALFEISRLSRVEDGWYLRFGPGQALALYWIDAIQVLGDVTLLLTMACVVGNMARPGRRRRVRFRLARLVVVSLVIVLTSLGARALFLEPFGPVGALQCSLAVTKLIAVVVLSMSLLGRTGSELLSDYARLWPVAAIGFVWLDTFFHPVPIQALSHATVAAVRWTLATVEGPDAFAIVEGPVSALIRLGGFEIDLLPVCSGYEGLLLFSGLFAAYLLIVRRWPGLPELVVYTVTLPLLFVINVLRIVFLLELGARLAPQEAIYGFHSRFGILAVLAGSCLAILAVERWRANATGSRMQRIGPDGHPLARDFLPLTVMLGMHLVLGFYQSVVDWLYPVTMAATILVLRWTHGRGWRPLNGPLAASILTGVAVYGLWIALTPVDHVRSLGMEAQLASVPGWWAGGWITVRLLGAACVVPVVEELAFRRGLWRIVETAIASRLRSPVAAMAALIVTSSAFAAMHSSPAPALLAGLAFGAIRLSRAGLGGAMLAHGVANGLLGLHVIATGEWAYW